MRQKAGMGVSSVRQTVISSGRSLEAQFISNGLSRKTQIATPVPIIATIGCTEAVVGHVVRPYGALAIERCGKASRARKNANGMLRSCDFDYGWHFHQLARWASSAEP